MVDFKLKNLMKSKDLNMSKADIVALVVLVAYLVSNYELPIEVEEMLDTMMGNVVVVVAVMGVFVYGHPVVALLSVIAAYELLRRSAVGNSNIVLKQEVPSENTKMHEMKVMNKDVKKRTLEEDVVSEMKPYVSGKTVSPDVKPVINNLHNASSLTDATTRLAPKISK
mgnify:FL=1